MVHCSTWNTWPGRVRRSIAVRQSAQAGTDEPTFHVEQPRHSAYPSPCLPCLLPPALGTSAHSRCPMGPHAAMLRSRTALPPTTGNRAVQSLSSHSDPAHSGAGEIATTVPRGTRVRERQAYHPPRHARSRLPHRRTRYTPPYSSQTVRLRSTWNTRRAVLLLPSSGACTLLRAAPNASAQIDPDHCSTWNTTVRIASASPPCGHRLPSETREPRCGKPAAPAAGSEHPPQSPEIHQDPRARHATPSPRRVGFPRGISHLPAERGCPSHCSTWNTRPQTRHKATDPAPASLHGLLDRPSPTQPTRTDKNPSSLPRGTAPCEEPAELLPSTAAPHLSPRQRHCSTWNTPPLRPCDLVGEQRCNAARTLHLLLPYTLARQTRPPPSPLTLTAQPLYVPLPLHASPLLRPTRCAGPCPSG